MTHKESGICNQDPRKNSIETQPKNNFSIISHTEIIRRVKITVIAMLNKI